MCIEEEIPFTKLIDNEFESFLNFDTLGSVKYSNFLLNPSPAQYRIIDDKLNNLVAQSNKDKDDFESEFDQPVSFSYYSCDEFIKASFQSSKSFSILYLNIHSIQKHIEELQIILIALNFKFDIIAIPESKLKGEPNVDIDNHIVHTDADKGVTILYVTSDLNIKPRKDLEIYERRKLESSFIEIINMKESNNIVGVIYRHTKMDTNIFIQ